MACRLERCEAVATAVGRGVRDGLAGVCEINSEIRAPPRGETATGGVIEADPHAGIRTHPYEADPPWIHKRAYEADLHSGVRTHLYGADPP